MNLDSTMALDVPCTGPAPSRFPIVAKQEDGDRLREELAVQKHQVGARILIQHSVKCAVQVATVSLYSPVPFDCNSLY